jgi:co-chaperonin GroES (HSP10)
MSNADFLGAAAEKVKSDAAKEFTPLPKPAAPPDFRPLTNYIVVWVDQDTSEKTEGGLFKPAIASKERPDTGEVVLCGPDVTGLQPGDRISFVRYAGKTIVIDGHSYSIMKDGEVYGVFGRNAFGFGD